MPEPAEQLRAAAQRLRTVAEVAYSSPRQHEAYLDTMNPSVVLALGAMLDAVAMDMADNVTLPGYAWAEAETLARLVLEAT